MDSPNEVKSRAGRLRDALSAMGHQLKHTESLEVISKVEGYRDWNTYSADIAKRRQIAQDCLNENEIDKTKTSLDHPMLVAMKLDDEALLKESLDEDVLSNKPLMAEAFYQSVVLNRVSLAELLITEGADVGSVEIRGVTLFEYAAYTERYKYAEMLVVKFKHLKGMHGKGSKALPLVVSLFEKDKGKDKDVLEMVEILLNQGANINAQNREGDTALILAGYDREDLNLVTLLVERGADVNIGNENGDTPLIDAVDKCNIEILNYLLNNGADIEIKNKSGLTALDVAQHVARHKENSQPLDLLLRHKGMEQSDV